MEIALGISIAFNIILVAFAMWQHSIIKVAGDALGVKI
jgi:hypothetical protein